MLISAHEYHLCAETEVVRALLERAVINWQQFNVGANQYVQFVQPNSSSVVLNRVTGSNPSSIFGEIKANGQVFLINPNGILFAPGSTLDELRVFVSQWYNSDPRVRSPYRVIQFAVNPFKPWAEP